MPVKKRNVESEVRLSWEPKKKSDFSDKQSPSYRTGHEEISLKVGYHIPGLGWFGDSLDNKITDRLTAAEGLFLLTAKETKPPAR